MKKIAFLIVLSLSLCLSQPAEPQGQAAAGNAVTQDPAKPKEQSTTIPTKLEPTPHPTTDDTHKLAPKPSEAGSGTDAHLSNATKVPIKADDSNKTSDKKEDKTEKTPASITENPNQQKNTTEAKPIDKQVTNGTTPEDKPNNGTITPNNEVSTKMPDVKTTAAPKSDADKHTLQARGFDGPSFIGGMVMTLGLLAVGFMGFKYYKNQTERNYHTL